jgi:hypothetical protein
MTDYNALYPTFGSFGLCEYFVLFFELVCKYFHANMFNYVGSDLIPILRL